MGASIDRRPLHPYAKVALGAALIGLGIHLALLVPWLTGSFMLWFGLLGYATAFTALLVMTGGGIGLHALVKRRWPGRTATEQARRPRRRDVRVVLVALAVLLVDLAALVLWWGLG